MSKRYARPISNIDTPLNANNIAKETTEFSAKHLVMGVTLAALPWALGQAGPAAAQDLSSFAIVSGATLTNTGATTIVGNIALSPGTSYTGSGSVTLTGEPFVADAVAARQQDRLTTLYNFLAGRSTSSGGNLTGQNLGNRTLTAGIYNFDTSAFITAGQTLTLDAGGDPNAIFVFNIGSTLTAGADSEVVLINGAQGGNVFYRVGSSATLHTTSALQGQIVALTSITMNTDASLDCGSAYARNGSVTLDTNTIRICTLAAQGFDAIVVDPSLSTNQTTLAGALSNFVTSGGVLPIEFAILAAAQSPADLADTLAQLSGEVATGVAPMGLQAMDAFLDKVMRSGNTWSTPMIGATGQDAPIGMVLNDEAFAGKYGSGKNEPARIGSRGEAASEGVALSFAAAPPMETRLWDVWLAGYGSRNTTDGDAARGYHERSSDNRGLAVGLNYTLNAATDVGVAVSWNEADFSIVDGFGSGTSDAVFVALRGRTVSDRGYIEGALAYGQSDVTTRRNLTIAGTDQLIGDTTAETIAAHVEAGYHMGMFTPFAGLRAKSITRDAYSETAAAGTASYAMDFDRNTTTSLRSELGIAMQWPAEDADGTRPTFGVRAAWAHELASNDGGQASYQIIPGLVVPVSGVTRDRDSLLLAASAGWSTMNGLYLDAGLNAEYSANTQDFGGSLTVGYRW
jgi:uncharacterized protein with beta-barrel porin domain